MRAYEKLCEITNFSNDGTVLGAIKKLKGMERITLDEYTKLIDLYVSNEDFEFLINAIYFYI